MSSEIKVINHQSGHVEKILINTDSVAPPTPIKMVSMAKLGELLPDDVLIELEDFKNITSTEIGKRKTAARILTRINSNVSVDVLHADFTTLLTQLVNNTSLTGAQATAILATLKE